ncbi:MAG: gliding motility lipoprotein GldH [Bacteroidota bacterium]|nr:gliding motility lipoprotein GldH [Bacteroidota bacterium]
MNYKDFNGHWPVYEKVLFTLDKGIDNPVNLMIYIRNNKQYPYSNLFLIAKLKTGDSLLLCDTLEYAMADAQGKWLGKGFLEVKESKLWWRENYQLPAVENINVQLEHALRSNNSEQGLDNLEGIVGVGFAVEEIQKDE